LLVDVSNPEAIADAVQQLLEDTAMAQRLGQNGRRCVETTYNWQEDERKLLEVFNTIVPR
jgi:glycosyltransferase involved in cell wall biosynthesis